VGFERACKFCYAGRRLAGLCSWGEDEEHETLCRMREAMARAFDAASRLCE
jgi:hypothetical protein